MLMRHSRETCTRIVYSRRAQETTSDAQVVFSLYKFVARYPALLAGKLPKLRERSDRLAVCCLRSLISWKVSYTKLAVFSCASFSITYYILVCYVSLLG